MANFTWTSWATTHTGKVRKINQDTYIHLPDKHLWGVADGMGGCEAGEYASAAITQALTDLVLVKTLGGKIRNIHDALTTVNQELIELAAEIGPNTIIGSTVVLLLAHQQHSICLWSGDSRLYLLRHQKLLQLSRDHNYESKLIDEGYTPETAKRQPFNQVLTHAIGADIALYLETQLQEIRAGDKFLLCSDGLTKELTDSEIEFILNNYPLEQAMQQLLDQTLAAKARDNVTLVVVEATESA